MACAEISLEEAWAMLSDDPRSELIDVRTTAEWSFVGLPLLESLGKRVRQVEWTRFPDGAPNSEFVEEATEGLDRDQPVLLICRSGARSRAAGALLEASGFSSVHNVTAGFEGDVDPSGHRHGGWKDALPWVQS